MFEHMAFKGTDKIGTTNYDAEQIALEKVEKTYAQYDYERHKLVGRDMKKVLELEKKFKTAVAEADKYVIHNQFGEIIEREGGEGLKIYVELGYPY